jgi:hypothetical protein
VKTFDKIFLDSDCRCRDPHPPDHKGFAGQPLGKHPSDPWDAPKIGPVLWPDHGVQGTCSAKKGYEILCLSDLTLPVDSPPDSVEKAMKNMQNRGIRFIKSMDARSTLYQI